MTPEYVDKIVTGAIALTSSITGALVGAFVTWHVGKRNARTSELKALKKGLSSQAVALHTTMNMNQMPIQLGKFKQFVIENPDLLLGKENVAFCEKWLSDPFIGVEHAGGWTENRRQ